MNRLNTLIVMPFLFLLGFGNLNTQAKTQTEHKKWIANLYESDSFQKHQIIIEEGMIN